MMAKDLSQSLGKLPPQAIDLEETILGAIMLEQPAWLKVADILIADDFYDERHKHVWRSFQNLSLNSKPIDMRSVVSQLRKDGKIEHVGGAYFIAELTAKVSSAANVETYARTVKEMALKRSLIILASDMQQAAYADTSDVFETIDKLQQNILNLLSITDKKKTLSQLELYTLTLQNLQSKKSGGGITGVNTGFRELNRITAGWQRSDLILIAARPGMGKTAFMLCTAKSAAKNNGAVGIFSLEMSAIQLQERLMSGTYEIHNDRMRTGFLEDHQWQALGSDPQKLSQLPIFIDDTAAISIMDFRTKARRLKAEHDVQLIIVDYLQLMRGDSVRGGNREQEISSISRGLKQTAKELNIPVIALSQLSRAVETRGGDKRPQLSDLRESGAIEQDADIVSFLYRPEYYGITVDEEGMPTKDAAEVIVSKHRNGGTGSVKIKFEGPYTRFLDYPEVRTYTKDLPADDAEIQHPSRLPYKDDDQPF
jgi:replicative DNA helicase